MLKIVKSLKLLNWEGSKPVELDWKCDLAILATKQPGMDVDKLLAQGIQVFDCTNSMMKQLGVFPI